MWDIIQVIPTDDYKVFLYFEDGKIKLFNAKELLNKNPYKVLNNIGVFKDTCTVLNGTLSWTLDKSYNSETCIDVDPFVLYETCEEVEEPMYLFKGIKLNSICPNCGGGYDGYYCEHCGLISKITTTS